MDLRNKEKSDQSNPGSPFYSYGFTSLELRSILYLKKDGDKSRKDYSEDIAIKIKVKGDTLEFQIVQHYAYEDKNITPKLMSELNSSLKRDEIKTNSWKRIMKMKCLPLIILMRPELRENYMHMKKRQQLKAKFLKSL